MCRRIRREGASSRAPVLVVTARRSESDVVLALESGADAIMHKPFECAELLWRVDTLLRRWYPQTPIVTTDAVVRVGALIIDASKRSARVHGIDVALTRQEFNLLLLLARHPGRVFSRRAIAQRVWGADAENLRSRDRHRNQPPSTGACRRCRCRGVHPNRSRFRISLHGNISHRSFTCVSPPCGAAAVARADSRNEAHDAPRDAGGRA
ncbi:MAG: response regulator transcription factor [Vicinamibacterales bacterium]